MRRPNTARVAHMRWVEAVEIFHTLYIGDGPYKSNVPRLVNEIVARLEGDEALKTALLSEFGRRGAATKQRNVEAAKAKAEARPSSVPVQLVLFEGA